MKYLNGSVCEWMFVLWNVYLKNIFSDNKIYISLLYFEKKKIYIKNLKYTNVKRKQHQKSFRFKYKPYFFILKWLNMLPLDTFYWKKNSVVTKVKLSLLFFLSFLFDLHPSLSLHLPESFIFTHVFHQVIFIRVWPLQLQINRKYFKWLSKRPLHFNSDESGKL